MNWQNARIGRPVYTAGLLGVAATAVTLWLAASPAEAQRAPRQPATMEDRSAAPAKGAAAAESTGIQRAVKPPRPESDRPVPEFKRNRWERAVGGIDRDDRIARQFILTRELVGMMPQDAGRETISVSLTAKDRKDLAAPTPAGKPMRIGVVKQIEPNLRVVGGDFEQGVTTRTPDGGTVWAITVTSPGAAAIRVHFTDFSLPAGTELFFHDQNGQADGPYTGRGRNGNGDFWTRSISADTGVIQLRYGRDVSAASVARISCTVGEVAHIQGRTHGANVQQIEDGAGGAASHDTWPCADNAACLVDANCQSGTPADPAKDAIAKMEWITGQFVNTCSGGLLADTVPASQIPYFLTANHCTSASIANLETWFDYTTSACNGVCPHNILTGGAPPSDTIGFTVLETNATSDFTLGTLDEAPPAGAVFLGWNSSPVAFTNGTQLWRISNANFGPQVYSQQQVDTSSPTCSGLPRGNIIYSDVNTGGTMGGSSGSPVVNSSSEVVGQLFGCCGFNCADDCASAPTNWTIDGAFAVTFPQVEYLLDPPPAGCTSDPDCDDGLFCNGAETCDTRSGNCQAGTPPNCDDGVSCTDDSCNESTNQCDNVVNNANCDDGLFCNGSETCHPTLDCQSGAAPNCDDGVGCTNDSCNEGTDSCDNIPSNGLCDDGLFCNGSETCDPVLDCQSGAAPNCDDGVGCTDDSCNETTNQCDNIANNANCDDGLFCNGAETCSATLDCQSGSDPCPGQVCLEATDECVDCTGDPDCDDGLFCNGAETCSAGACQSGAAPNCDDGVGCTDDSCNEGTDQCDNVANNANCDDGLFCNGSETCSATLDCQAGAAVNCDDGVGCTDDSCNEGTNSCDNIANDANCPDDGLFCNGTEFCDPVNDCSSTGDPCGGAGCDVGSDTCAGPVAQLEAGSVSVGAAAVTVNLAHTYVSPVIAATVQYNNNSIPVVTRITTVTSNSFDIYLQNPGDLSTPVADNVSYLVVEQGAWTIDGVNIEAQTYNSTVTDENNSWVGEAQSYNQSYINPVVLGQVMSVNDPDWSVFWCRGTAQGNPPTASSLFTGKHVAEDPDNTRAAETVGFIVFEAGHGTIGGVEFEAALGPDTVLGVDNAPPYTYTFSSAFAAAPTIGVVNIGGMDGGNGGWGQIHGPTLATATQLNLSIDEDQINDPERNRTTDQIEYVVFASAVVYPPTPQCSVPADCDDGQFCDGVEDCVSGSCVAGTPPNCDDGVACTDDFCNEGTDSCDNVANNANCDNGLFCDGSETCDPVLDCQSGTAPNCDDGVACTVDSCNETTDSCDNTPDDGACDNGQFCDGAETCDPGLGCQAGSPVNCDDGVACTDDSCNEGTDSCDNIANNGNCPDDGLFCNGTEFCDAVNDCSSTGDPCAAGEICNETTDTCDPGSAAKLEAGTVSVGSGAVTVNLNNSYTSPVIVTSINYNNNTIPVVTRISSVTSNSFAVRLQNAGIGGIATETVHYLVVEEGAWTIDGVKLEAQAYNSTVTDQNNSWVGQAQSYLQSFVTPVVLGQVMSENDADWSVFWDQGGSRTSPPSSSALRTGKTVCEDSNTTRANETVGFIVFEAGHGTIGGVEFEADLGADSVRGVGNSPPYSYPFEAAFAGTPAVAIVTMAAMDGVNGGWAYLFGPSPLSATQMNLAIDEDTIQDTERNHTTEQVGYVVFRSPVTIP